MLQEAGLKLLCSSLIIPLLQPECHQPIPIWFKAILFFVLRLTGIPVTRLHDDVRDVYSKTKAVRVYNICQFLGCWYPDLPDFCLLHSRLEEVAACYINPIFSLSSSFMVGQNYTYIYRRSNCHSVLIPCIRISNIDM